MQQFTQRFRRNRHHGRVSPVVSILLLCSMLFTGLLPLSPVAASVMQQSTATFYRGINFGGGAVTIGGNNWVAGNANTPNLTLTGDAFCDQSSVLNPAASGSLATMLRCAYWAPDNGLSATLTNVPSGDYQVYLYTWESDPQPQTFSVSLEGQTRLSDHSSGDPGSWFKHGPWQVTVSDGTIELAAFAASGNYAMFSGLEVYRLPEPTAGGFSFYRGINLGGSAVTIGGNSWIAGNSSTPNLTLTGDPFCDQNSVLAPPASGSLATMLRCAYWTYDDGLSVSVTNVPNGEYRVYLYTWESDPISQIFSVTLEGQTRLSDHASGEPGYWFKHGPWQVTISDGTINLAASALSGNYAMFSGLEVYRFIPPTVTPTNTPTATSTNTPTAAATNTATSIPPTATNTRTATSVPATATNTPTGIPPTATNTPTGIPPTATNTRTATSVPPTVTNTAAAPTATPNGGTNLAPGGVGYRWAQNTSATSNGNRVAATGVNDGNLTVDVELNGGNDDNSNAWEGAGVVWASAQSSITRVEFTNGSYTAGMNGVFSANFRLQTSSDGTTWVDATGWSLSPAYPHDTSAAGGATFVFTGSASNLRGVRVVGQVHTTGANSWYASARELKAFGSATSPTNTPTNLPATATNTPTSAATATNTPTSTATATHTAVANTPPTISDIPNQVTTAGQALTVNFTISDAQTSADSLTLNKGSSNEVLLPANAITFGGSGTNRTATLTPAVGQIGTVTVTLTVSDGSLSASDSFVLTVDPLVPPVGMAVVDAAITVNRAGVSDQPLRGMDIAPGFGASIGDPVELADGSWREVFPALGLGGRGLPIIVSLYYSTRHWNDGFVSPGLNLGWVVSYDRRLVDRGNGRIDLQRETGEIFSYLAAGSGTFTSPAGNDTTLSYNGSAGEYTLSYRDGLKEYYTSIGLLNRIEDRFGNRTLISWNASSKVRTITNERTGQAIELAYADGSSSGGWQLREIRDAASNGGTVRVVSLGFNPANQLATMTDEAGKVYGFRYDTQGRVDQYTDPNLKSVTNTYASAPAYRVATQVLPSGTNASYVWNGNDLTVTFSGNGQSRSITFAHDAPGGLNSGRVTSATHPNSSNPAFGANYNSSSWQPTQVIDPSSGQCSTFSYNARRDVIGLARQNAASATSCGTNTFGTTTLSRDVTYGYTTGITDALGFITTFGYNTTTGALERQTVVGQGGGSQQTGIQNNTFGQPETVTLADGTVHRQSFDTRGYPDLTTYDQGGLNLSEDADYDWRGFLTRSVNLQGVATTYDYYANGWLKSSSQPGPQGGTITIAYEYDNVGNVTKEIVDQGGLNATTSYRYEPIGTEGGYAVVEMTDAEGNTFTYQYNVFGQVTQECIAALSRCTSYSYTSEGWPDTTTLQDGRVIENRDYYPSGQLQAITDGRGVKTTFNEYDNAGRLVQITRGAAAVGPNGAANAVYRYTYNANDQVTRIDGPNGFFVTYDYSDPYNRLKSERDALGKTTSYTYHPTRNWMTETVVGSGAEAITTKYEYDRLGRRKQAIVDQAGQNLVTQYQYSASECGSDPWNLQKTLDPKGNPTITCYNPLALLSKTTDANNQTWLYSYNNLGCMIGMTPPTGAATSYGCDKLNRQTSLTRDGQIERWTYRADDALNTFVDFAGRTTSYTYDVTGRQTRIDYPAGPDNAAFSHSYTYYDNDLLKTAVDPNGTTSYDYDSLNLMASRTRDGRTVSYTNNANGWLTSMDYWGEGNVAYGYRANGELSSLNPWSSGAISYDYRSSGLLSIANRPGTAPDTSYSYDTAGRLTSLAHGSVGTISYTNSDGTPARDKNGNILRVTDWNGATSYSYDALNRLDTASLPAIANGPNAESFDYDYDAVGNRTGVAQNTVSTTYAFDASDRLKDAGASEKARGATYDSNGNLTEPPANDITGTTSLVSVASDGTQGNNVSETRPAISGDGRYVAFASIASNLIPSDTNNHMDVFVQDRQRATISRVSVTSNGIQGDNISRYPAISGDGRYVAFVSNASNLVAGDTNGTPDIFVHDRQNGTTIRASVASDGTQGNNMSLFPAISGDGRYVAFNSRASNLVAGDINGVFDVFVHDRQSGTTIRVSAAILSTHNERKAGAGGNQGPAISTDGRYVAFVSYASNLVAGDTNDAYDVFVYDQQGGTTSRVSVASDGTQGNSSSPYAPAISGDGRYVAFNSLASNLVAGDTNNTYDTFVHDRQSGTTSRVSVTSDGTQGNQAILNQPAISGDGRYVAFEAQHTFLHDRQSSTTTQVSVASDGTQGNSVSVYTPAISGDGRYVAFNSFASNLVEGDANGYIDTFVHCPSCDTQYTYDTANRLIVSVTREMTTTYTYDAHNNIIREVLQAGKVITDTSIVLDDSGELARVIGEIRNAGQEGQAGQQQSLLYAYGPDGFAAQKITSPGAGSVLTAPGMVLAARAEPRARGGNWITWLVGLVTGLGVHWLGRRWSGRGIAEPVPVPLRTAKPGQQRVRWAFRWLLPLVLFLLVGLGGAGIPPASAAPPDLPQAQVDALSRGNSFEGQ